MRYSKEVAIGGDTYRVSQFNPTTGLKTLIDLAKIVGEPFALVTAGAKKDALDVIPSAVKMLLEKMDSEKTVSLIKDLIRSTEVKQGDRYLPLTEIFDLHFQGRLGVLFKVLVEIVKVNYEDFSSILSGGFTGAALKD